MLFASHISMQRNLLLEQQNNVHSLSNGRIVILKKYLLYQLPLGGAYYAFKALSPDAGNMEQRFIGNITFIFPFIVALCNFVYIYCCSIFFRGYYVSKY